MEEQLLCRVLYPIVPSENGFKQYIENHPCVSFFFFKILCVIVASLWGHL